MVLTWSARCHRQTHGRLRDPSCSLVTYHRLLVDGVHATRDVIAMREMQVLVECPWHPAITIAIPSEKCQHRMLLSRLYFMSSEAHVALGCIASSYVLK